MFNPTCVFKFLGAVLAVLFVARNTEVLCTADIQPLITSKKYYTVNYDFHNECSTFESLLAMFCFLIRTPQIIAGVTSMSSSSFVSRDPDIVNRNPAAVEPQNLKVNKLLQMLVKRVFEFLLLRRMRKSFLISRRIPNFSNPRRTIGFQKLPNIWVPKTLTYPLIKFFFL